MDSGRYTLKLVAEQAVPSAAAVGVRVAPLTLPTLVMGASTEGTIGSDGFSRYRVQLPFDQTKLLMHDRGTASSVRWSLLPVNGGSGQYNRDMATDDWVTNGLNAGEYWLEFTGTPSDAYAFELFDLTRAPLWDAGAGAVMVEPGQTRIWQLEAAQAGAWRTLANAAATGVSFDILPLGAWTGETGSSCRLTAI